MAAADEEHEKLSIEICQLKCFSSRQSRWQKDFDEDKSLYLDQIKTKIEHLESRNVELHVQIQELVGEVRNLSDNLTREREIVSEQNRTIKLLKIEISDLLTQSSDSQEELVSLLCERRSVLQSLAQTKKKLQTLERQVIDQEDIILHCQQQLENEKYSRDVLLRKLENYSWTGHQHSVNLELTSKRTDERGDLDSNSDIYEEDDLCIPLVHRLTLTHTSTTSLWKPVDQLCYVAGLLCWQRPRETLLSVLCGSNIWLQERPGLQRQPGDDDVAPQAASHHCYLSPPSQPGHCSYLRSQEGYFATNKTDLLQ